MGGQQEKIEVEFREKFKEKLTQPLATFFQWRV